MAYTNILSVIASEWNAGWFSPCLKSTMASSSSPKYAYISHKGHIKHHSAFKIIVCFMYPQISLWDFWDQWVFSTFISLMPFLAWCLTHSTAFECQDSLHILIRWGFFALSILTHELYIIYAHSHSGYPQDINLVLLPLPQKRFSLTKVGSMRPFSGIF